MRRYCRGLAVCAAAAGGARKATSVWRSQIKTCQHQSEENGRRMIMNGFFDLSPDLTQQRTRKRQIQMVNPRDYIYNYIYTYIYIYIYILYIHVCIYPDGQSQRLYIIIYTYIHIYIIIYIYISRWSIPRCHSCIYVYIYIHILYVYI